MQMANNSKLSKIKNTNFVKIIFHIFNILLIIFYLYPGSILGCILYKDCKIQPQLTPDFIVSSNHVYIFILISLLGLIAYSKKKISKKIIIYFFLLSIFLEFTHLINPERSFEMQDLGGNIIGVVISYIIFLLFKFRKKNGFF